MNRLKLSLVPLLALLASGCSTLPDNQYGQAQMGNLILVEPLAANMRSQMALARYNQILGQVEMSDGQRAELLYQRGMLYDSVGLSGLAQFDFSTALKLKPNMAEAYNFIGIHHTQNMEFIQAYEAFDATLEIDPNHEFAFLNRGIALYYGGRPELAIDDLNRFYAKDETDPYRVLWTYIAEYEVSDAQAQSNLRQSRSKLSDRNWATLLVDFYLGDLSEQQLLASLLLDVRNQQELANRLCEAYFYLGKYYGERGNRGKASNYFKLALSTNVYEFVEHRYARLELDLLREEALMNSKIQ
ncbi:lipoprotein NlpI [Aliiglaciecola sp. CAU 1673]|uniref:lipoprotein NlpI n=1 Tax=Aliiglaciecola sp. CAU 1673 TaxID=3032595 RepID=UPI0023DA0B46|nr:lipoprotein NlpI [Aliiglaciecola sp. CAU 1673]MDF2180221.1 lipoprotein NlpI [Aliiglaciecola sp. CAU 1673]